MAIIELVDIFGFPPDGWIQMQDTSGNLFFTKPGEVVLVGSDPSGGPGCVFSLREWKQQFRVSIFTPREFLEIIHASSSTNDVIRTQDAVDLVPRPWGNSPYVAGAPINDVGPFTAFKPTRVPRVTLAAGGVATVYTIIGTKIGPIPGPQTAVLNMPGGGGVLDAPLPFTTIASFTSDVDPQDVTTLDAYNTHFFPPSYRLWVGVGGTLVFRLFNNTPNATYQNVNSGEFLRCNINFIAIDGTTCDNLFIGQNV